MIDLLVVGYGNDLRRDDGAGRLVAEAIDDLYLPGVRVRSLAQLTPELALDIGAAARVVFVDASVDAPAVTVDRVAPGDAGGGVMTHHGDPGRMLTLAATVGAVPEEAIAISIPAQDLGLGAELSPATASGVAEAIELIVALAARAGAPG